MIMECDLGFDLDFSSDDYDYAKEESTEDSTDESEFSFSDEVCTVG